MSTKKAQADNITMSSGGLYSLATLGAKDVIDKATPIVLAALATVPQPSQNGNWCFSDMGCADGGTSLDLWRAVVQSIRAGGTNDIQIVYADQVFNDFNALAKILHGNTVFDSYLPGSSDVHVLQSASSFYQPILPKQSLHLGFSATAMHWLSEMPCNISNHIHMVGATGHEKEAFATQAALDWHSILLHRSRELVSGGKLVLVNFCIDEKGHHLGNTGGVNMFDNFNKNWQTFLEQGTITEEEYKSMTLPQYYNNVEEFSNPLTDTESEAYRAGLRLDSIQTEMVPCPFAVDFQKHGDAAKFAKAYIPTIRSWNESVFKGALSDTRSAAEKDELIEAYYSLYEQQVRENPEGHGMGYVHAYMTVSKV